MTLPAIRFYTDNQFKIEAGTVRPTQYRQIPQKGIGFLMGTTTVYAQQATAVNPAHLTDALRATLALVSSLSKQTGYCYARAPWLAATLEISESQLSRRLKQLREFGLIAIEYLPGLKRLIRPLSFFAPPMQAKCKPDADSLSITEEVSKSTNNTGADSVVVSPLLQQSPKIAISPDAIAQNDNSANAAPVQDGVSSPSTHGRRDIEIIPSVQALQAEGINPHVSRKLARERPSEAIRRTIDYCRQKGYGTGAIVRAITEEWTIPEAITKRHEAVRIREAVPVAVMQGESPDMAYLRGRLTGGIGL